MKRLERFRDIMDLVEKTGNASIPYLSGALGVSESTVRRDLTAMTAMREYRDARRVHGGLVLGAEGNGVELMFELKLEQNRDLKEAVALAASHFIEDGDSIILDSGTTCFYLARCLKDRKRLHVLTTDVMVAAELARNPDIETNIVGGAVRPGYYTIGGLAALADIDRFVAEKVFLSVDAVDMEQGITNASEFEVGIKQKLIRQGKRIFILADATKFGRRALHKVEDLSRVHTIVTNSVLAEDIKAHLRGQGAELVLAGPSKRKAETP
ncbi:MAG: DeoR/GlpR family DNA-binding transcription regulator [Spirochaetota bacterium]